MKMYYWCICDTLIVQKRAKIVLVLWYTFFCSLIDRLLAYKVSDARRSMPQEIVARGVREVVSTLADGSMPQEVVCMLQDMSMLRDVIILQDARMLQ